MEPSGAHQVHERTASCFGEFPYWERLDTPWHGLTVSRTNKASPQTVYTAPPAIPDRRLGDAFLGRSPGSRVFGFGPPSPGKPEWH